MNSCRRSEFGTPTWATTNFGPSTNPAHTDSAKQNCGTTRITLLLQKRTLVSAATVTHVSQKCCPPIPSGPDRNRKYLARRIFTPTSFHDRNAASALAALRLIVRCQLL